MTGASFLFVEQLEVLGSVSDFDFLKERSVASSAPGDRLARELQTLAGLSPNKCPEKRRLRLVFCEKSPKGQPPPPGKKKGYRPALTPNRSGTQ